MAKKKGQLKYRKFIGFIYIGVAAVLIYTLSMSVYRVVVQRDQLATLTKQLEVLESEKKSLSKEVELLNDEDYVTRYARDNYVFPRDGEEVVKLPDVENPKK